MNDAPHAFTTSDDPCARAGGGAEIEAALIAYAEAYEAGPIPQLTVAERRQQGLAGLMHVAALDPGGDPEAQYGARFISIHHKTLSEKEDDAIFPGAAHQDFKAAISEAFYWALKAHDVYWAMGGQAEPGVHYPNKKHPSARRWERNTVACRCLYMDVDVKPNDPTKAYPSTRAAAEALISFFGATGLRPTMVFGSGTGGFHAYWRLEKLVTPAEFKPMAGALVKTAQAHRLKFDAQCTNDVCRLLRVPGTWNFKGLNEGETGRVVTTIFMEEERQ
jgi:hypothetical protein